MKLIKQDLKAWCVWKNKNYGISAFLFFFLRFPEFRRLVSYRLRPYWWGKILRLLIYPTTLTHNLYIYVPDGQLGGGFRLMHGYSTTILCKSMGENCMVNHLVAIGWAESGIPTIGNNVWVCVGARILGDIKIGDDVIVSPNAVVTKDIPPHSIVGGIPAKIIKTRKDENSPWEKVSFPQPEKE